MKTKPDDAVAEVRAARSALCARFGNDPRRLLAYLREEQRASQKRVIKNWSEQEPAPVLCEAPTAKKRRGK